MSTPATLPWPPATSENWLSRLKQQVNSLWKSPPTLVWLEWTGLAIGLGGIALALLVWIKLHQELQALPEQGSIDASDEPALTVASTSSATNIASATDHPTAVTVYVTGAVKKPGVYHLSGTSLFMDAILAAGGFSNAVWQDYLDQFVNLAQPLTDHQKIWIPKLDQQALFLNSDPGQPNESTDLTSNSVMTSISTPSAATATTTASLISVNSATSNQLMALSGIGEKRAEDIIANRPYQSLTELTSKAKIPASIFQQIQAQLTL